jgi:hypothetical protein
MTILNDPNLERLLDRLHERSDAESSAIREHYAERDRAVGRTPEDQAALTKTFLADKIYALDRDKAEFCYQLCRAIDARRVVETAEMTDTALETALFGTSRRRFVPDSTLEEDGFELPVPA